MLAAMKAMHVQGVMLEVGFPLLVNSFPNAGGYTSFHENVAKDIHADGMTLSVEVDPVFRDPQISSLRLDRSGLTVALNRAASAGMAGGQLTALGIAYSALISGG